MVAFFDVIVWPAVVLITLWYFRDEIKKLLERLNKIGKGGAEFGARSQPKSPQESDLVSVPKIENLIIGESIEMVENLLKEKVKEAKTKHNIDVESNLLRMAADAIISLKLERAYLWIFGSQIGALEYIRDTGGCTLTNLQKLFDAAVNNYPDAHINRSFEQWYSYLINFGLIVVSGDRVNLTADGKAFLPYINIQAYPSARPG